jgi:cell pole-organizing protein PopZ
MAAEKTSSILQNIKSKLNKFDQKNNERDLKINFGNELDYSKKTADAVTANVAPVAVVNNESAAAPISQTVNNVDPLGLDTAAPTPQAIAAPAGKSDEVHLDDLDFLLGNKKVDATLPEPQENNPIFSPNAAQEHQEENHQETIDENRSKLDELFGGNTATKNLTTAATASPAQDQEEEEFDDLGIESDQKTAKTITAENHEEELEEEIEEEEGVKEEMEEEEVEEIHEEEIHEEEIHEEEIEEEIEEDDEDEELHEEEIEEEEVHEEEVEEEVHEEEIEEEEVEQPQLAAASLIDSSTDAAPNNKYRAQDQQLLSEHTISRTHDSIKRLMNAHNAVSSVSSFSKNSEALSDIALNIMEPKIEDWLNRNLPSLVENIVREEIKKILPKE